MATVYISFGSNIGDRTNFIHRAISMCGTFIQWEKITPIVETSPYGKTDQPPFLNAIGKGKTSVMPEELLKNLQEVERSLGRLRDVRWGPRTIDLDILTYDDVVQKSSTLTLPHPDLHNRDFLLTLLCEYFPEWRHPVLAKDACSLLDDLTTRMPTVLENNNLRMVLSALGNPQDNMKTIYVTGSSGKGSVASFLASLFNEKVGLFLSPYVCDPAEMVSIKGNAVNLSTYKQKIISVSHDLSLELTPFEVITGAAYLSFSEEKVPWAIVETGLESKGDATNVKEHDLTVICSLGLDHSDVFEDFDSYLEQIRQSVSGDVVCMEPVPGLICEPVKDKYIVRKFDTTLDGTSAFVKDVGEIHTKMVGLQQIWNILLAGEAYEHATHEKPDFSKVKDVFLPARFQVARKDPLLIVDGGHNEPAFRSLVENMESLNIYNIRVILGLVQGKDVKSAIKYLSRISSDIAYYPPFSQRALASIEGLPLVEDLFDALREPVPTLVAGSFYLAGPVLRHLNACPKV
ncbi:2-amino-4-hydroxy-6-hydroxymethyldihydropteridine diphosphokinase [Coprothermobacter platensis]|uniref:2-amino-4-hydroxy-6- hydroxymethyldihydropteridine diphosphokinase n=1 Tax=Coprothermobacter platensis TaxID=108819 RepID=UPI0003A1CBA5|nr:2-amino-4-hydroxy-6-hydroxymethyldihydropteridine diphosphokinase [Coprothermobacter platensis]